MSRGRSLRSIHFIWFLTTWVTVGNSRKCVFVLIWMLGFQFCGIGCLFLVCYRKHWHDVSCQIVYPHMIGSKSVKPNYRKVNRDKKAKTGKSLFLANSFRIFGKLWRVYSSWLFNQFSSDLDCGFKHPSTTKGCLRTSFLRYDTFRTTLWHVKN